MDNTISQTTQTGTLSSKFNAVIRLTRWREHVPYTIPLVVAGAMLAVHLSDATLDWRLLAVVLANILAMAFAFVINDVEDAPDDALNPAKKEHNVISSGLLTRREGILLSVATFVVSLALYAVGGVWSLGVGAATLILCYLYSAYPFRFKARPITDVTSHALMLSGLIILSGYWSYSQEVNIAWLVIIAATLFSAYGQFYNQIEDYEVDKEAGLKNTVVLIGKQNTTFLMYGSILGAAICMILAAANGAFPAWLGTVALITVFSSALFTWDSDMRGNPAEGSGMVQKPSLLVANVVILLWMAQQLGLLSGL